MGDYSKWDALDVSSDDDDYADKPNSKEAYRRIKARQRRESRDEAEKAARDAAVPQERAQLHGLERRVAAVQGHGQHAQRPVPERGRSLAAPRCCGRNEDARRHRSLAKLCYVCCRVVRALFARGLCEEADDDGPQDSGRTEDCDGTGMGEGDVSEAKDVSNEIDNEEQLLGLKDEAREASSFSSFPRSSSW